MIGHERDALQSNPAALRADLRARGDQSRGLPDRSQPLRATLAAGRRLGPGIERAGPHFSPARGRPALRRHLLFALVDRATRAPRSARGAERSQYPVAHRVRGGNQSRLARGVAVQERGTRDRFGRFCAEHRTPGAGGYVSRAAAFRRVLPEDAKGFADGPSLVAVPFVRVGKSGRVPGREFARALSRGDGAGRELYAVSRYAQRYAAARRDSDVSFA